jgi:hypothetical protein
MTIARSVCDGVKSILKRIDRLLKSGKTLFITYELLSLIIKRSSNIISLFKELENIRINV